MSFGIVRFHVDAAHVDEVTRFIVDRTAEVHYVCAIMPDASAVFALPIADLNTLTALEAHPQATLLPAPCEPLEAHHPRLFPHVEAPPPGAPARELYRRLRARHRHPIFHPALH